MEYGEPAKSLGEQVIERDPRFVAVAMHLTHIGEAAIEFGIVQRKSERFFQEMIAHEVALRLVHATKEQSFPRSAMPKCLTIP